MNENESITFDLMITGATVVLENGAAPASIGIKDGKVEAILDPTINFSSKNVLDATGKVMFPGLIDPHVHLYEPGPKNYREDFLHGTQAAAAGGISTIIEMPLSDPPVVDKESFDLKLKTASNNASVDFALWGGLIPSSIEQIEELHQLGCVGFKAFISYASDTFPQTPDFELWKAMSLVGKFNGLVGIHAENAEITYRTGKELEDANVHHPEAHSDGRPEIAELEAVQRAILFAEKTGCTLYLVHLSLPESIEMVRRAKERGINVFSETCPQYLLFDRSALAQHGSFIKCNPPLRSKDAVEGLWEEILNENIDCIGSDHSPYTDKEKTEHGSNIWKALPGFGGIELLLPVLLNEGYHKRKMKLESIARIASTNIAKAFGMYPRKGTIRVGSDADLTLVDLNEEWSYDATKSFSKTKSEFSPYHNMKFKGRVTTTIVRGTPVYQGKEIVVKPGYGQFTSNK